MVNKKNIGKGLTNYCIAGKFNNCEIYSEFGVTGKYENYVKLSFDNGITILFDKFFYGRPSQKTLYLKKKITRNIVIEDLNAFEKCLCIQKLLDKKPT